MNKASWALLACVVMLCGCPVKRAKAYKSPPESPADTAFRKSMEQTLEKTARMTFTFAVPIPDGGSWMFGFKTDSGASFDLQFLHGREDWGGNPQSRVIRVCDAAGKIEFDLRERSPLEAHLIRLMSTADIAPDPERTTEKLTPKLLSWLAARTKDRILEPVPD